MKRLEVITPQGNELVALHQNVNCVTGSILINDEFHDAYVSMNGTLHGPLGAGRYSLDPGFSPFFARWRTYATGGKLPINVSVFFVRRSNTVLPWATGEFVYTEQVISTGLPVRAAAGGRMIVRVSDSRRFLTSLVGLQSFNEEETDDAIYALIAPHMRSAIATALTTHSISAIQGELAELSAPLRTMLAPPFREVGLELCSLSIGAVNINDHDLTALQELNRRRAAAAIDLEAEQNRLNTIYGGDVRNRTSADATLAFAANQGMAGSPAMQMAMLPMMMGVGSQFGEQMQRAMDSAIGNSRAAAGTAVAQRTPHESNAVRCRRCGNLIQNPGSFCPHCGMGLNE